MSCCETEYISPAELVARYRGRISEKTLANWRTKGGGPKFTKIGGKIMYSLTAIQEWENKRTFETTAKRVTSKITAVTMKAAAGLLVAVDVVHAASVW